MTEGDRYEIYVSPTNGRAYACDTHNFGNLVRDAAGNPMSRDAVDGPEWVAEMNRWHRNHPSN